MLILEGFFERLAKLHVFLDIQEESPDGVVLNMFIQNKHRIVPASGRPLASCSLMYIWDY